MDEEKKSLDERLKHFPELQDMFDRILSQYEKMLVGKNPADSSDERMEAYLEAKKKSEEEYDDGAIEEAFNRFDIGEILGQVMKNLDPSMMEDLMGNLDLEGIEDGEEHLENMVKNWRDSNYDWDAIMPDDESKDDNEEEKND